MSQATRRQAHAIDATGLALTDQLRGLRAGDAMLALAYTNPYREVAAAFQEAHRLGRPLSSTARTASSDREGAIEALERLNDLRRSVIGKRADAG